jgi:hypothetical protein
MTNPEDQGTGETSTPVFVEDLFLTESFLIKGRMARKYHRLTKMLEDNERSFLGVEDATMVSLRGNEVIRTPSVLIHRKEIIFAHELVEIAGDNSLKKMAHNDKSVRIRAFYNGAVQVELAGKVEPFAYETLPNSTARRFFVMLEPVLRGINLEGNPELRCLKGLPYAIVQKEKLAYVYDFS